MGRIVTLLYGLSFLAVGVAAMVLAAPEGLTRTELQRHDLSIEGHEAIQTRVEFAPGAVAPWHSPPGEELIYVPEGKLEFQVEGEKPVTFEAGKVFFVPAGRCIWRGTLARPVALSWPPTSSRRVSRC